MVAGKSSLGMPNAYYPHQNILAVEGKPYLTKKKGLDMLGLWGDSSDLAAAVGAFPDCNLLKEKAEICYRSKQPGVAGCWWERGSVIQPPEGISLQENYLPYKAAGFALKCYQA